MARNYSSVLFCPILTCLCGVQAADLPHLRADNGVEQLVLHGKPFLIRGGELGNSSAGTPAQADTRSEEHTSELQSPCHLVCRLLLETNSRQARQQAGLSTAPAPVCRECAQRQH